jgi:hypothetical protein
MPATILVEAGAGAGREFPVQEEVFRVGSGPACRLRLPDGVEAHAATVEFRNGGYVVYNKGARPLQVEGRPVAAMGFSAWAAGQRLQLTPGVVLRLRVEGDPAPARFVKPAVREADLGTDVAPEAAAPAKVAPKKSSRAVQWAVIGLCLVAVPILLWLNLNQDVDPDPGAGQRQFEALVKELRVKEPEPEAGPNALWSLLESARAAELRGEAGAAEKQYSRILIILRQRGGDDGRLNDLEKKAEKFARGRIRRD